MTTFSYITDLITYGLALVGLLCLVSIASFFIYEHTTWSDGIEEEDEEESAIL